MPRRGPKVGRLVNAEEARPATGQHLRPCSDCPFARASIPGWLGSLSVEDWLAVAHGGGSADCHALRGPLCAGLAIYQRNTCTMPRGPRQRELRESVDFDRETVFANRVEFAEHHRSGKCERARS